MKFILVGNPNTGKSTFFNRWTGLKQTCGNWPGVTVEKHIGQTSCGEVVDLPGIYSLHAVSEDEKVATQVTFAREYDCIINVVDAVNLERNLYLSLALSELNKPMIIVLTMVDLVTAQGRSVNWPELSKRFGVSIVDGRDIVALEQAITHLSEHPSQPCCLNCQRAHIDYPPSIERALQQVSREGEPEECSILRLEGILPGGESVISAFEASQGVSPDVLISDARYATIYTLVDGLLEQSSQTHGHFSSLIDRVVLNRWLGLPIFLLIMYALFWFTQIIGGAFIDFFDLAGSALFVTAPLKALAYCHAPDWLNLLVSGLGTGLQTVATFVPPVFFIFLGLSILEDSGYMARAAYVMDRIMRFLGLPGGAFVPMLVGFGCSVPAIMATRTLSSRRDRIRAIFLVPFMSCGARLPVYALFGAAFFGAQSGLAVFMIYFIGILLAIGTGLLLKYTLLPGQPSAFIMELPLYHRPSIKAIMTTTWERLRNFVLRAGQVITIMVLLLSLCEKIPVSNDRTLVTAVGQSITPVFSPMGVETENWQASVALVMGLFAKEAVVGSLQSLYAQEAQAQDDTSESESVTETLMEACKTLPTNLATIIGITNADEEGEDNGTLEQLRKKFTKGPHQAFAYLLFILLYVPCLAAVGTIAKEIGARYTVILSVYLTVLGWSVATLYYQIAVMHSPLWLAVSSACLLIMGLGLKILGSQSPRLA